MSSGIFINNEDINEIDDVIDIPNITLTSELEEPQFLNIDNNDISNDNFNISIDSSDKIKIFDKKDEDVKKDVKKDVKRESSPSFQKNINLGPGPKEIINENDKEWAFLSEPQDDNSSEIFLQSDNKKRREEKREERREEKHEDRREEKREERREYRNEDDNRSFDERSVGSLSYTNRFESDDHEKSYYFSKLESMRKKGYKFREYTLNDSLADIRSQYNILKEEHQRTRYVEKYKGHIAFFSVVTELLDKKFNTYGPFLDGWSEQLYGDLDEFDDPLEKMYEKWGYSTMMSPEVEIVYLLFVSAFSFFVNNHLFQKALPNIGKVLSQKPDLVAGLWNATAEAANMNNQQGQQGQQQGQQGYQMAGPDLSQIFGMFGFGQTVNPIDETEAGKAMRMKMMNSLGPDIVNNNIPAPSAKVMNMFPEQKTFNGSAGSVGPQTFPNPLDTRDHKKEPRNNFDDTRSTTESEIRSIGTGKKKKNVINI